MTTLLLYGVAAGLAVSLMWQTAPQAGLCALLTKAEAEEILGKPLAPPEQRPGGDCWYPDQPGAGVGGDIILHVLPDRFDSKEKFHAFLMTEVAAADEGMKKAMEGTGATFQETKVEPVSEVKAPAYYADPTLFVLQGGRVLAIAASRPHALAVAAKALPRFR